MPSGIKKSIKVKVHIIGQFIVQTRFVCQFNIEGRVTSVNAQLLADTIYCDHMEFSYTSRAPNITATFAVIWGGSKPLDNPDNIHGESKKISLFSNILIFGLDLMLNPMFLFQLSSIDAGIWQITVACVMLYMKSMAVVGVRAQIDAKSRNSVMVELMGHGHGLIVIRPVPKLRSRNSSQCLGHGKVEQT